MLVITSREFRENQQHYLDKIDAGEEILMHRGKMNAYRIIPVKKEDTPIDEKYYLESDKDFYDAITAKELLSKLIPRVEKLFEK